MSGKHESAAMTFSDRPSLDAREQIFELMKTYPATDEEAERSLGLFLRGSLLARIFAIREVYENIVDLPGIIMDLGTWRGQTAVICENLRAIFEPLHFYRRIICFDTFEGYKGFSDRDQSSDLHRDGTYKVESGYDEYLNKLLVLHEKSNAMGHNYGKHMVIRGDCRVKVPDFFSEHSGEVVALAFFDLNAYDPTLETFRLVWERLVTGGVVAFWQLTRRAVPAEGRVYSNEILNKYSHSIQRSQFYPGLCYIIKK